VLAPLGRGAQASVFRARQRATGREVALKLFPRTPDPARAGRFRREAAALSAVRDPGVVQVFEHGFVDEQPYMALELIPGRPLSEAIREGLSQDQVIEVARKLAVALRAVHAAGISHRDVKPANVLLDGPRVVLVDFGLAHLGAADRHSLTQSGALIGTPAYMAPELATGKLDAASPAVDVYSWGVTVFEAVAGRPPFSGETLVGLLRAIAEDRPPGLRALRPDCPQWLAELVARCLAKSPRTRPSDGAELVARFDAARAGPNLPSPRWPLPVLVGVVLLGGALSLAWPGGAAPPERDPGGRDPVAPADDARHTLELRLDPLRGQDAFVDGFGLYTNDNGGASLTLFVGQRSGGGQTAPRQSYVRFPLERVPAGVELESATLELREGRRTSKQIVAAYRVLSPWDEGASGLDASLDGVAWGPGPQQLTDPAFARPKREAEALGQCACDPGGAPARWDVTAAARAWLADPASNYGLCLAPLASEAPQGRGQDYRTFRSRDHPDPELRPLLRLTWVGPPPTPDTPYDARLAQHRARTAAALRDAKALLPEQRLRVIEALLVQVPSDVELRCARIRAFLDLGRLESAITDCRLLGEIRRPPYPAAAIHAAAEVLDAPQLAESVHRDRLWSAWWAYWRLLDSERAPRQAKPARAFRLRPVQQRIAAGGLEAVLQLYRRGAELWPHDTELRGELDALPGTCVLVAKALAQQGHASRARAIAVDALRLLECREAEAQELERLAEGR